MHEDPGQRHVRMKKHQRLLVDVVDLPFTRIASKSGYFVRETLLALDLCLTKVPRPYFIGAAANELSDFVQVNARPAFFAKSEEPHSPEYSVCLATLTWGTKQKLHDLLLSNLVASALRRLDRSKSVQGVNHAVYCSSTKSRATNFP